jgi:hypothetical protein
VIRRKRKITNHQDCAKKKKEMRIYDICLKDIEYLVYVCQKIHQSEHCRKSHGDFIRVFPKKGSAPSPQFKELDQFSLLIFGDFQEKETEQDSRAFSGSSE